jgi:hypothetical protein
MAAVSASVSDATTEAFYSLGFPDHSGVLHVTYTQPDPRDPELLVFRVYRTHNQAETRLSQMKAYAMSSFMMDRDSRIAVCEFADGERLAFPYSLERSKAHAKDPFGRPCYCVAPSCTPKKGFGPVWTEKEKDCVLCIVPAYTLVMDVDPATGLAAVPNMV